MQSDIQSVEFVKTGLCAGEVQCICIDLDGNTGFGKVSGSGLKNIITAHSRE